jgi:hypothetical protein
MGTTKPWALASTRPPPRAAPTTIRPITRRPHPITTRVTGAQGSDQLLGAQLVGRLGTEVSKRVDIFARAIYNDMTVDDVNDLDLSYTPPLGSPWGAAQQGPRACVREHVLATLQRRLSTV